MKWVYFPYFMNLRWCREEIFILILVCVYVHMVSFVYCHHTLVY